LLKNYITDPVITIHPKFGKPFSARNCLHIMMTSNADWVVPADHGARRYAVFRVNERRIGDHGYFKKLHGEIGAGGVGALIWDLLRRPLGEWHPKRIYATAALVEQKQRSLRGLDAWIEAILQDGVLPGALAGYPNRALTDDLVAAAKGFDPHTNSSLVPRKLQNLDMLDRRFNVQVARGWAFRPLTECRSIWEARCGGSWPWHRPLADWGKDGSLRAQLRDVVRVKFGGDTG
jgi:hypothetical protein